MVSIRPFVKADTLSKAPVQPSLLCPRCSIDMRLFGIEADSKDHDLYTFECVNCGGLEVRRVQNSSVH